MDLHLKVGRITREYLSGAHANAWVWYVRTSPAHVHLHFCGVNKRPSYDFGEL